MVFIIILVILLIVTTLKALQCYISLCVYISYIDKKQLPEPTDEEIKSLTEWVVKNIFSDIFKK